MYEAFELPVIYKDEELLLPAQLFQHGYVHRFQVEINSEKVLFERDDEGAFRALINPEEVNTSRLDKGLLQAVVAALEEITT